MRKVENSVHIMRMKIYNRYLKLITAGGAETWMARYFNQGVTVTYPECTKRYEILNALLGVDMVNEMFLVSNHHLKFNHSITEIFEIDEVIRYRFKKDQETIPVNP